ncbi:MAG: peptide chain release factor N(5)-glutamine methyltransferase [Bacteroidetes bacterium]|nr:peptide chain release factor N(5)-glutamine methyltransferase [Bacteroidota bacterium]
MDFRKAQENFTQALQKRYDAREAAQISEWIFEYISGLSRSQRLMQSEDHMTDEMLAGLQRCQEELLLWRPVQYVLGEAYFAGMTLQVDERVLIPRPETEELVEWCLSNPPCIDPRILDAGTGSGCIALAIKRSWPLAEVWGVDKSVDALEVATANARATGTDLRLMPLDLLDRSTWHSIPLFDIMISNPPYVPSSDKAEMRDNVLRYEPYMALFVDGNDPLLFYDALSRLALEKLLPGGALYLEIHASKGVEVLQLLQSKGFEGLLLKKDLSGRDRMVRAIRV